MKKKIIFYAGLLYVFFSLSSCFSMGRDLYIVEVPQGSTVLLQSLQIPEQEEGVEESPSLIKAIACGLYKVGCCFVTTAAATVGTYYTLEAYKDNNQDEASSAIAGVVAGTSIVAVGLGIYASSVVASNWFRKKQAEKKRQTMHFVVESNESIV